jgi:hypothetical protein
MKAVLSTIIGAVMIFALVAGINAADKDETLKGKITCAKCDLKLVDKCAICIVVKKDGKDVVYFFDPAAHKKYHGDYCKDSKEGSVTGTVSKKGDKMMIKVDKLETK